MASNPSNPPGPPMTLGNMRELDFSRFADIQFFVVPTPSDGYDLVY
jgi:hypothetical protein